LPTRSKGVSFVDTISAPAQERGVDRQVSSYHMLYLCIPAYDEAPTIGLLLWRIRKVFENYPREYEILVLNDGSTDGTAETLEPYREVLPLTVLRHEQRRGYAAAVETLLRAVAQRTRYPRRDAAILMQADFTDQPEHLPELIKRHEGGADLVVAEQAATPATAPVAVRRLRRVGQWLLRPFLRVPGVRDPLGTYRLMRITVVRDLLKENGEARLLKANGWAANVELLAKAARFARRIEVVSLEPRYDLRPRATRVRPLAGAMDIYRFGRTAGVRRAAPTST
jgi:glycosyltransferase involved in cell wall biosynthesis